MNTIPTGFTYGGYDSDIAYSGNITYNSGSLQQTGSGVWPDCAFATGESGITLGDAYTACSIGAGAPESAYSGVLAKLNFTCGASAGVGTLTLSHTAGRTDLVDSSLVSHTEAGASESLTINCVTAAPSTPPAVGGISLEPSFRAPAASTPMPWSVRWTVGEAMAGAIAGGLALAGVAWSFGKRWPRRPPVNPKA